MKTEEEETIKKKIKFLQEIESNAKQLQALFQIENLNNERDKNV